MALDKYQISGCSARTDFNMKTLRVWLVLALVFFAGFAGGTVVTRGVVRNFISHAIANPDMIRLRIEGELNRELGLNPRQRREVRQILVSSHERLRTLRQEFQPQLATIAQDTRQQISAVLTPEQEKKFEQFELEHRPIVQRVFGGGARN